MANQKQADKLDAWVEAVTPRLLAFAMTLVHERAQAEDLVHDCFARLFAKADQYDLLQDGTPLMFKSVSNACINWLSRHRREEVLDARSDAISDQPIPDQRVMGKELEQAIETSLAALPVSQRTAIELRSMGYSLVDIAEVLHISHANARVQLHRPERHCCDCCRLHWWRTMDE